MMKIYYSVSVRGQSNLVTKEDLKTQIEILSQYGDVLTKHLASDNASTIDMGGKTDEEIYEEDERLVKECDIFIGEVTNASLGVGFIMSQALKYKKKVVCFHKNIKLSAMINGCSDIKKYKYSDIDDFSHIIQQIFLELYFDNPVVNKKKLKIICQGPPGSGKTTVCRKISEKYSLAHISTGEILRNIVKNDTHKLSKLLKEYMGAGKLIPADIMYDIIETRLNQPDCLINGFIMDGYPPSIEDIGNLIKLNVYPDLIFSFICDDNIAIKRQCNRKERSTDECSLATERVKIYHETTPDYTKYFSQANIIKINANKNDDRVYNVVSSTIGNILTPPDFSYFIVPPFNIEDINSTKFHFHIDGKNRDIVADIAKHIQQKIPDSQGQIKIYNIESLHLGPQIDTTSVYQDMMNFHEIENSTTEAFATGRLGDFFDFHLMTAALESALAKSKTDKCMIEIEEYVGEWNLENGVFSQAPTNYQFTGVTAYEIPEFDDYLASNIPPFELHLGFNLIKESNFLPISLSELMSECQDENFCNGGWFIFKNPTEWVYRSNEFSYDDYETSKRRLFQQAASLSKILNRYNYNIPINLSLEIVHNIWHFN